jgi:acyl-coenzyme A thioesterase PaaI-like protein
VEPTVYWLEPPAELRRLAAAVRTLMDRMVLIDDGREELERARAEVLAIAARLETVGRKGTRPRITPDPGPDDARPFYNGNAPAWDFNPINPPLAIELASDGTVRARATLSLAFEGPPGCAHGGVLAHIFDQLLGYANVMNGIAAFTGSLNVRFHRPTPLGTELAFEVPPAAVEGRKAITRGRLRVGDVVTAEAEGLFVMPKPGEWTGPGF